MNYITGQSVETTINQFKRLQDEPLQMSLELEKANHHLTAAQLEQIRTLELQGDKTAAAKLAIDAYAQSINDATTEISDNLGHLESAWVTLKKKRLQLGMPCWTSVENKRLKIRFGRLKEK